MQVPLASVRYTPTSQFDGSPGYAPAYGNSPPGRPYPAVRLAPILAAAAALAAAVEALAGRRRRAALRHRPGPVNPAAGAMRPDAHALLHKFCCGIYNICGSMRNLIDCEFWHRQHLQQEFAASAGSPNPVIVSLSAHRHLRMGLQTHVCRAAGPAAALCAPQRWHPPPRVGAAVAGAGSVPPPAAAPQSTNAAPMPPAPHGASTEPPHTYGAGTAPLHGYGNSCTAPPLI